jgi:hypothetical protein
MAYPSGNWDGFWQQTGYGRQSMREFTLMFSGTTVVGRGTDLVGPFTIRGTVDPASGRVAFRKQYVGRHHVDYVGQPDGEGCILGTWNLGTDWADLEGSFLLRPVLGHFESEIKAIEPPRHGGTEKTNS